MKLPEEVEIGKLTLQRMGDVCLYDGEVVHLPGQRHELVMLLAQALKEGKTLSHDELCKAIWGESKKRTNLHQAVAIARRDLTGTGIQILNVDKKGFCLKLPD